MSTCMTGEKRLVVWQTHGKLPQLNNNKLTE